MIVNINAGELKHLTIAMARNDVRYYLNAMCVQHDDSGKARLACTDGYRLNIWEEEGFTHAANRGVMIPSEYMKHLLLGTRDKDVFELDVQQDRTATVKNRMMIQTSHLDATFPDIAPILDAKDTGERLVLGIAFIKDLAKDARKGSIIRFSTHEGKLEIMKGDHHEVIDPRKTEAINWRGDIYVSYTLSHLKDLIRCEGDRGHVTLSMREGNQATHITYSGNPSQATYLMGVET